MRLTRIPYSSWGGKAVWGKWRQRQKHIFLLRKMWRAQSAAKWGYKLARWHHTIGMKRVFPLFIAAILTMFLLLTGMSWQVKADGTTIASCTTSVATSTENRVHNVRLAAKFLDGYTLAPGATLSFNKVVGKRTEKRGFRGANVILDGRLVEGVGGGVCQVSSSLYNAALRAGLTAVTSSSHTLPVSYLPLGFDAMVSEEQDLIIKNTTVDTVWICTEVVNGKLTVRVYRECNGNIDYRFQTEFLRREEKENFDVIYLQSFRNEYIEGRLVRKTPLRISAYRVKKKPPEEKPTPLPDGDLDTGAEVTAEEFLQRQRIENCA